MAYYHIIVLLSICFLFIYGIIGADLNDIESLKSRILSQLRFKRAPCEIRNPFTGGCSIPGPRSPF
jgi:hypothetical protein